MRNVLLDIIKHTSGLSDTVKITGTDEETNIEAQDDDKTVIIKGKTSEPIPEFKGEFGMSNLAVLKGFLDLPNFKADDASVDITREKRDGVETPTVIHFKDGQGQMANFRLMSAHLVPNQASFRGVKWDVEFTPTRPKIQEFAQFSSILASHEQFFIPRTKDGKLRFHIGDDQGTNHSSFINFADDINGQLKSDLMWPIQSVLSILKLQDASKIQMKFADKGALQITVNSELGEYNYILPARRK